MRLALAACFGSIALSAAMLTTLAASASTAAPAKKLYSFLGAVTLPDTASLDKTIVGGLSGIAYDGGSDTWYLISDDKSEHGPARFYTLKLSMAHGFLNGVHFTGMVPLTGRHADENAAKSSDKAVVKQPFVDPEAIAFTGRSLLWTSEDNWKNHTQNTLREMTLKGVTTRDYPLPDNLLVNFEAKTGPRDNNGLEALAITPDRSTIWLGMEEPLTSDAPLPDDKRGAPTRLTEIDRTSGTVEAQYVYPLEKRARAALPGKHADGPGLDEMAAIDATHLLTMERSWVEGVTNFVQIYLVDTAGATNVAAAESLKGADYRPVKKTLLIDLNRTGIQMDNYEGMALGPKLADGRRLLLLSVDNNFNPHEKTIIAAFAVDLAAAMKQ